MKVFRALKTLWSSTPALISRSVIGIIAVSAVVSCLLILAMGAAFFWLLSGGLSGGCPHLQRMAETPDVSGFDFEVRFTDCWIVHEMGVFASRSGQRKKTLIFLYDGLDVPTITSVDEHTIKIALPEIGGIYCVSDQWQGLNIRYEIRSIRGAGHDPEPQECRPE